MSSTSTSDDLLNLKENRHCLKMLRKLGDNFPTNEQVKLSMNIIKINKRGMEQERIFLCTDKAFYNLKRKEIRKCRRRIDYDKVKSITMTTDKDLLVVHYDDYDQLNHYNYKIDTNNQNRIVHILDDLCRAQGNPNVKIERKLYADIDFKLWKLHPEVPKIPKLLHREYRMKRFKELIGKDQYDDEIPKYTSNDKTRAELSQFEVIKIIGRTSECKVFQVRNKANQKTFALKIFGKNSINDKKLTKLIGHPFLMVFHDDFQTENKFYFLFDYDDGHDMFRYLKRKTRFTEGEIKLVFCEVILALEYLHSLDIIYGALKPENISLNEDGHISLITDFGFSNYNTPVSNMVDECLICGYIHSVKGLYIPDDIINILLMWYTNIGVSVRKSNCCDTFEYWSPEMVKDVLYENKSNDFWSLGVLIYEMMTGIPPFYSQYITEIKRKIVESALLFPPNLSNKCKDLISKLLDRDLDKRLCNFNDVKSHSFFEDMDWDKICKKEIEPKYKRPVSDNMFIEETVVAKNDGFGNVFPIIIND